MTTTTSSPTTVRDLAARFTRRHAGVAVLALIVPVVLLPGQVLMPLLVLAALGVGGVELVRWVGEDGLAADRPAHDDPHEPIDARLVDFRR